MLAWKQPFIQRVRNSSLVEGLRVDNTEAVGRASDGVPVGEHCMCGECRPRGLLERMEKQM